MTAHVGVAGQRNRCPEIKCSGLIDLEDNDCVVAKQDIGIRAPVDYVISDSANYIIVAVWSSVDIIITAVNVIGLGFHHPNS